MMSRSFELQFEIDCLLRRYEKSWHAGQRLSIVQLLANVQPAAREAALIELIATEVCLRLDVGEHPRLEEYASQFPECRKLIEREIWQRLWIWRDFLPQRYLPYHKLGDGITKEWLEHDVFWARDMMVRCCPVGLGPHWEQLNWLETAAHRLRHTNTVKVYGIRRWRRTLCIAMEFVDGVTLDQAVKQRGPLNWQEATRAIRDAAQGLAHAHDLGLVHGEIKPANLLRSSQGVTKVAVVDLILEHWHGRQADARSELNSLMCTYYFLLTGKPPYDTLSDQFLTQHDDGSIPDPRSAVPDIPSGVWHVLSRGAAKNPRERYQTNDELVRDLERLLRGEPVPQLLFPPILECPIHHPIFTGWNVVGVHPGDRWRFIVAIFARLIMLLGLVGLLIAVPFAIISMVRPPLQHDAHSAMQSRRLAKSVNSGVDTHDVQIQSSNPDDDTLTAGRGQVDSSNSPGEPSARTERAEGAPMRVIEPGVLLVDILPARTELTVLDIPVQSSSNGQHRRIEVHGVDRQHEVVILARLPGYQGQRQQWVPTPGRETSVVIRLEPLAEVSNSLGMKLVFIPAGQFFMGSRESANTLKQNFGWCAESFTGDYPRHRVRITRPFYLGIHEVTVGQFREFVRKTGYRTEAEVDGHGGYGWNAEQNRLEQKPEYTWKNSGFAQDDTHPVIHVSWTDAVAFCRWLSREEGSMYRLPSEAEWEYACRGGKEDQNIGDNDAESLALFCNVADASSKTKFPSWTTLEASDGHIFTAPVGHFRSNAFGLFDIHGNVGEWCHDWYEATYYFCSPVDDPQGPSQGLYRVFRGGGWDASVSDFRSGARHRANPLSRVSSVGFRVALGQLTCE